MRVRLYRTVHQWHWISAALGLAALLIFALTGISLNHATSLEGAPSVLRRQFALPVKVQSTLRAIPGNANAISPSLARWLEEEVGIDAAQARAEWSAEELYLSHATPGRDAWLAIDRNTGTAEFEVTERGWVAYLNDLHKGRNTGAVWGWFIDAVALACIVFALTGLVLLQIQARQRRSTWPVVGGGVAVLAVLMILFSH